MQQKDFQTDLDYILTSVTGATTVLDELTLLRAALRYYAEGHSAEDSVAWAAHQISNSITNSTS